MPFRVSDSRGDLHRCHLSPPLRPSLRAHCLTLPRQPVPAAPALRPGRAISRRRSSKLVEGVRGRPVVPDSAGGDGLGQDLHDGQRDRAAGPSHADHGAQQDARRAALLGDARVLSGQRGGVLRLLLRLLSARGLRPRARPVYREGLQHQRAHRADAAVGDQVAAGAPRHGDRGHRLVHLRHRRPGRLPQHDPAPARQASACASATSSSRLAEMQYERNELEFRRGTFRVRGDVLDIFPAENSEVALSGQPVRRRGRAS